MINMRRLLQNLNPNPGGPMNFPGDPSSLSPYTMPPVQDSSPPMQVDVQGNADIPQMKSTLAPRAQATAHLAPDFTIPDETPAEKALREAYMAMPQQHPSGWFNKLTAAMGGASAGWEQGAGAGVETARNIRNYPYQHQLETWQRSLAPLQYAAQSEAQRYGRGLQTYKTRADVGKEYAALDTESKKVAAEQDNASTNVQNAFTKIHEENRLTSEANKPKYKHITDIYRPGEEQPHVMAVGEGGETKDLGLGENKFALQRQRYELLDKVMNNQTYNVTPTDEFTAFHSAAQKVVLAHPEYADFYDQTNHTFSPPSNAHDQSIHSGSGYSVEHAWENFRDLIDQQERDIVGQRKPKQGSTIFGNVLGLGAPKKRFEVMGVR